MKPKKDTCAKCNAVKENKNIQYCNQCNKESVLRYALGKLTKDELADKIKEHERILSVYKDCMIKKLTEVKVADEAAVLPSQA